MEKSDLWDVILLLVVLAFAVVIVEERWLRVAIAFVPSLLLAQKALYSGGKAEEEALPESGDRRVDAHTRNAVDELLRHIREFYLTAHLMGSGKMDPDEATEKASELENKLNRLLARITDAVRDRRPV